jgi:hypothetical protein
MAEQEIQPVETAQPEETKSKCGCGCKGKCCKIFSLKGLSLIYKIISVLTLVYLLYILGAVWYFVIAQGASWKEALFASVQFILVYGFFALVMITVSKVLKVLKKIKHAVVNK